MANHKSSIKRIRQDKKKSLHNKYYAKTMRNAVRNCASMTDKGRGLQSCILLFRSFLEQVG